MRKPEEAIADILSRIAVIREQEAVELGQAVGRVLARDVVSDVDLPPFQKSAMDGYAVRSADFHSGGAGSPPSLTSVGESRAGLPFAGEISPGECIAIYTGAEVPTSCDAVVMVEKTRRTGDCVTLDDRPSPGQNICNRGEDLREGTTVLTPGRRLTPVDLSVLAAVGCDPVPVLVQPRVAVLTTGDELVRPAQRPGPGQIREGNTYHLAAMARAAGADARNLGTVRDEPELLEASLRAALDSSHALITTGGVSMGRYDLVGAALEKVGVEPVFHKVAIKPGKPIWFGMRGEVPVFALPGNPVSCLVCFEVFVRPALAKLGGAVDAEWKARLRRGRWEGGETRTNARQQNLPVTVEPGSDGVDVLRPLDWKSSADIVALTRAAGLAVVEADARLKPGELALYRPLDTGRGL